MVDFKSEIDHDGVNLITWDVPGTRMNIMSWNGFFELEALMAQAIKNPKAKGVVITTGKPDFTGGMDLKILAGMQNNSSSNKSVHIFKQIMRIHGIFRMIELAGRDLRTSEGGKPVAIALDGTTMGIGYELALSCHRIFCAENTKGRIGLPEIKVGLFPGAGGTTRLVRRLGAMAASPFILEGRIQNPDEALSAGMIDEVIPREQLLECARQWVLTAKPADTIKPWDMKGFRVAGGQPYTKEGYLTFTATSAMVNGKTQGVYPAAKAALEAMYEGLLVPFDLAIRIEAKCFSNLLIKPASSAMINSLFVNKKLLDKGLRRQPNTRTYTLSKIGVIGAGMMGSGIATVAAQSGIDTVMIDRDETVLQKAMESIDKQLTREVQKNRMSELDKKNTLSRIFPDCTLSSLKECDIIIEAVFEDPKVKTEVLDQLGKIVSDSTHVFSNTSTLPISNMAKSFSMPKNFAGMHFFSPVTRMSLVEIIRGKQTSDETIAAAFEFIRTIRKTPILVNDARFFYANRCIIPYINEGVRMIGEGVRPAMIENCAKRIGMPLGPLQLIDETSLDLAAKIADESRKTLGESYTGDATDKVIFRLCELHRYGRKSGGGFYEYDEKGKRVGIWSGLSKEFIPLDTKSDPEHIKNRLFFIQVIEALNALESGVLEDVREGDVGAIYGWGFAPWSGGPFSWIDNIGAVHAVKLCAELEKSFGQRFSVPDILKKKAEEGTLFYS